MAVLHLLYIEDEPDHRNLVTWVLSDAGWDVKSVSTIEEAGPLLEQSWPHMVLLDLHLGWSATEAGFDTLRTIKEAYPDLPVVVTSVSDFPDWTQRALALGAAAFIRKPVKIEGIDAQLRRLVAGV
ncbi:MAG: response regulator [Ardenticatenaceae bacterium]|nr:response regulator [Ardenticatenaceae bacterium]